MIVRVTGVKAMPLAAASSKEFQTLPIQDVKLSSPTSRCQVRDRSGTPWEKGKLREVFRQQDCVQIALHALHIRFSTGCSHSSTIALPVSCGNMPEPSCTGQGQLGKHFAKYAGPAGCLGFQALLVAQAAAVQEVPVTIAGAGAEGFNRMLRKIRTALPGSLVIQGHVG